MAKYCGKIGFSTTIEVEPGIWEEQIVERTYYGDSINVSRNNMGTDKANSDINVSTEISIIADPFANDNFYSIKYLTFMKHKWTISNVRIQYPRLVLSLGGLYNE